MAPYLAGAKRFSRPHLLTTVSQFQQAPTPLRGFRSSPLQVLMFVVLQRSRLRAVSIRHLPGQLRLSNFGGRLLRWCQHLQFLAR